MRKTMMICGVIGCISLLGGLAQGATTVWKIGTRDGDINPIQGASEYSAGAYPTDYPGLYIDTFEYTVGSDANPIGAPTMPGLLGEQPIGHTINDGRPYHDTARVINITFNLPCVSTGLTLWYGRYGSETNVIKFNGETKATIEVPNKEGKGSFTEHEVALGPAQIGDNVITIEYADGGQDNGHYIDYVKLVGDFASCQSFSLCAGQTIPIGEVYVSKDCEHIYVNFVTDEVLLETHVHVATSLQAIPQTKKGNPIPGQFDSAIYYPDTHLHVFDAPQDGAQVFIAAHAAMGVLQTMRVTSGTGVDAAYGPLSAYAPKGDGAWVLATAENQLPHSAWTGDFGAPWITVNPLNPTLDTWRWFREQFDVPGSPVPGSLRWTVDNAAEVFLNDVEIDRKGAVTGTPDDDQYDPVTDSGDRGIFKYTHVVDPLDVLKGLNTLDFICRNYAGTGDNPAGLTYEVTVDYYESGESAWGDGCEGHSFAGKNWATYFTYTVSPCE